MNGEAFQGIAAIGGFGRDDDLVAPAAPTAPTAATVPMSTASSAVPGEFARLVGSGLDTLNDRLISSQVQLQRLAVGDGTNLHQVMMNLEETRLDFQLFMQVRNRALEAYQDLMKMQI
ncbi:flagellar hook-basal body complex protein FliE [Ramlibacter sp.]|uniref:flagellar hook-basal body complex protein FliE n=1 Tax=Ramlibacter sp. TaxID=1917967 RepID=UPI003D0D37EA